MLRSDLNQESSGQKLANLISQNELKILEQMARSNSAIAEFVRTLYESSPKTMDSQDTWQQFSLVDAYKKISPIEYIVDGIFAVPSLNIIYGAPGTLKSFLLADLSACIVSGKAWLLVPDLPEPTDGWRTHQSSCMWVDFDNGIRRTHERFGALGKAYDLPHDAPLMYYTMPVPRLNGRDKSSIGMLSQRIKDNKAKFVVIDNLGYVSGGAEENSSEMVSVMANFRELVEETQTTINLIHHQRKSNGSNARIGESLRGHSSIEGAIDLALLVERIEGSDHVIIKSTKDRGEKVKPFAAVFSFDKNPDGTLASARFFGDNVDHILPKKHDPAQEKIDQAIIDVLNSSEKNKQTLIKEAQAKLGGIGEKKISTRIDAIADQSIIGIKPGEKPKEKIYFIPEISTGNQQLPLITANCETNKVA